MEEVPGHGGPRRSLWTEVGIGVVLAALCWSVPALRSVLRTLMVVVHETGHALVRWLYGYPAVPALDLRYGGGVTRSQAQSLLLVLAVYALLLAVLRATRDEPGQRNLVLGALVFYAVTVHTPLHGALAIAAGHGFELVVAGIFLHRSASGTAIVHELERPLYACVGCFFLLDDLVFGYRLITSPLARARYQDAKGGGHWMDFSRLAEQWLHVPLEVVAGFFVLACLAVPGVVWWVDRRGRTFV